MKVIFRKVHRLLSIPLGILFSIACITGALLVFQQELLELTHRSRYWIEETPQSKRMPLDSLVTMANRTLVGDSIVALKISNEPHRTIQATLSKGRRNFLFLNPYTGAVTGEYDSTKGFFAEVRHLHRWFLFKEIEQGRMFTGWATVLFLLILVSGLLIALPKKRKRISSLLQFRWSGKSAHQRLFSLHKVIGVYLLIGLLLLSLTGLMWSFKGYREAIIHLFGLSHTQTTRESSSPKESEKSEKKPSERAIPWEELYRAVQKADPEAKEIRMSQSGVSILPSTARHERELNQYRYNPRSKRLELTTRFGEVRDERYAMTWAYLLHTGTWGGAWSQWLTFVIALGGATLPLTGYLLFLRKHKKKKREERRLTA